jgi:hypothetical protein
MGDAASEPVERNAGKRGEIARKYAGIEGVIPGVFCARGMRRTHVLKKRNVGNSSAENSRGGKKRVFWGARRRGRTGARGETGVARGAADGRATRRGDGGVVIGWGGPIHARMLVPQSRAKHGTQRGVRSLVAKRHHGNGVSEFRSLRGVWGRKALLLVAARPGHEVAGPPMFSDVSRQFSRVSRQFSRVSRQS